MLMIEEVGAVPLFLGLPPAELARVAQHAADIHLHPGEHAVHAGEERALFVVLAGKIEVTKLIDGMERTIGWRRPGQVFGEVPIVLGGVFLGSFRASEASRVMRLEARDYYAVAAASPEVAERLGALATERIGGLQGLAAEAPKPRATVLGHRWDAACQELRRFLTGNQVVFEWLAPDAPESDSRWPVPRPAERDFPAVRLTDGTVRVRPQPRELAELLGLQTVPHSAEYDTVIVGGGPAGLAAAVYGASEGLRTLVVEREAPGGQAGTSSRIENYLGFPNGVSGDELAGRALQQARRLGAEILATRCSVRIDPAARTVVLDGAEAVRARTIILATGVSWRRLAIDGFDRFIGKGVYYGAARSDASGTQGLDVHLIGAGNSAGQAALHFANHARTATLVVRGNALEKSMSHYLVEKVRSKPNIRVELESEVQAVNGDDHLQAIDILDRARGTVRRRDCGGLFVFIGADAETGWLPGEIARDRRGYVLTGVDMVKSGRWSHDRDPYLLETSVPGVFACGDVRFSPVKRVASAVGEGSMAIAFVHQYLQHDTSARPPAEPRRADA
ncbi:MAG: FAD-dependent oxidoreductase [Burkholderiales bacterium]